MKKIAYMRPQVYNFSASGPILKTWPLPTRRCCYNQTQVSSSFLNCTRFWYKQKEKKPNNPTLVATALSLLRYKLVPRSTAHVTKFTKYGGPRWRDLHCRVRKNRQAIKQLEPQGRTRVTFSSAPTKRLIKDEKISFLGCDAVWFSKSLSMFRNNVPPPLKTEGGLFSELYRSTWHHTR